MTVILGEKLNAAVNQYRIAHPTDTGNLSTKTWAILKLLKKGLAAEGIQV